jgi:hypothetical protein
MTGTDLDYLLAILVGAAIGYTLYRLYCGLCWLVRLLQDARLLAQEEIAYLAARRELRSRTRRFYLDVARAERAARDHDHP